jgi:predicted KAP-like P-loop ATPase
MLLPDHETEVDFLNCDAISRTVVNLLKENRNRALTVGIHGDWGAGKSSILKMIESQLKSDKNVTCLWFNGWAFEGFEDAKTALIEVTIAELSRQRSTIGKVKESATRLLKRVDLLKVVKLGSVLAFNLLAGIPSPYQIAGVISSLKSLATDVTKLNPEEIQARVEDASSLLKPADEKSDIPETIYAFRDEFSALLEEAKIDQLVILIDDLDRCLPETSIATLEAIRLFLFVPKTAFIIATDEAMIEYAVRQHFPDLPVTSGPLPYVRNYLEKLVQVPFRIPALGVQEARTYVTLLLVQNVVGEEHMGFKALLTKAKEDLSKPWLGLSLLQQDVQRVDPAKQDALNQAFVLAQQIGPILADGTKGNPRQIKRFLNALLVRQEIARARGFGDLINQAVLAKLMLAERFQQDFYDLIATQAMVSEGGQVIELSLLEQASKQASTSVQPKGEQGLPSSLVENKPIAEELLKWLDRDWLRHWLNNEPKLSSVDLRPYIFVARDKRLLARAAEVSGLDGLIAKLCGPQMSVRGAEVEVKTLSPADAEIVFGALRERILAVGNFSIQPPGIEGLAIVAKHHPRFQSEVVDLLKSIDPKMLGFWVVRGWNETINEDKAKEKLLTLIEEWAKQDDNLNLKKAAVAALPVYQSGGE